MLLSAPAIAVPSHGPGYPTFRSTSNAQILPHLALFLQTKGLACATPTHPSLFRCFENARSGGRSLSGCHSRIKNQNQFFQKKPLQGETNTQQNMQDKPWWMLKPPLFPHKASTNGHLVAPSNPSFIPSTNHMVGTPYFVKCLYELTFLLCMLLNQL